MKLKNFIIAFIVISIAGTLGHFVYEWTNNTFLGYFFPVSESTWEHLKLLFFPTVIFSIIEYFIIKDNVKGYWPSVVISIIVGLMTILSLFYTYSGVLGFTIDGFNIAIYYIAVLFMLIIKSLLILSGILGSKTGNWLSFAFILAMTVLFIIFTYNPPNLGIFEKP